jgi:hypothetical protein
MPMHKKMKNIISKIILFSIIYLGFYNFSKAQVLSVEDFEKNILNLLEHN